jgi:hypothetical protein
MGPLLRPLIRHHLVRYGVYLLIVALVGSTAVIQQRYVAAAQERQAGIAKQDTALSALHGVVEELTTLRASIQKATDTNVSTVPVTTQLQEITDLITAGNYTEAHDKIFSLQTSLDTALTAKETFDAEQKRIAEESERQKGDLIGTAKVGDSGLGGTTITLFQNGGSVNSSPTDDNGVYSFHIPAGTYIVKAEHDGYIPNEKEVVVVAGQRVTADLVLTKPTPTSTATPKSTATPSATATPASTSSTAHSRYYTTTLNSPRGTFSAYVMSFELGVGKIKVITDTASDTECATDCPVLSVKSYVEKNGGLAGVNGTYFCPKDYSSCTNEVNSFFWKILNSRLGKMINQYNTLGENDPFLTFDSVGNPHLYTSWNSYMSSGQTAYAGINHKPLIVNNGQNILDESTLDDKQKNDKITRAALAVKGSDLYVVSIGGANVADLAAAVASMGIDYALNIDAGGSRGWYYNGSYKLGPGRSVPNALVFVQQ